MINFFPFVKREDTLSVRPHYATNLSSRYEGWAGLYDKHGQCTMILIEYE